MKECYDIFENVHNIHNPDCLREADASAKLRNYKKGEIAVMQGTVQQELPFIVKGSFWGYYISGDGKCLTDCVADFYGCPVTSIYKLEGFLKPSDVSFEALEDSTVMLLPTETVMHIITTYQEAAHAMGNLILISYSYHRRMQYMNAMPIADRYRAFCNLFPTLSLRLSKTAIAACLNVSLPALSRALADENKLCALYIKISRS